MMAAETQVIFNFFFFVVSLFFFQTSSLLSSILNLLIQISFHSVHFLLSNSTLFR